MFQGGGGGQVGRRRGESLAQRQALLGQLLECLGRVAELVQPVIEDPVLTAVYGFLTDEARDLTLEVRIGDLVAVVADRSNEEVLAIGEHGRQGGGQVAADEVAISGVVLGQVPQRLFERHAAGRNGAIWVAGLRHLMPPMGLGHDQIRIFERFSQVLDSDKVGHNGKGR